MNIIGGGIAILAGVVSGSIFAALTASKLRTVSELHNCVSALKNHMCSYSVGLSRALSELKISEKCELFADIKNLSSAKASHTDFINTINASEYDDDIKASLKKLFEAIEHFEESELSKAFDATLSVIQCRLTMLSDKKNKNAPLYRKLGFLGGLSIAILIL